MATRVAIAIKYVAPAIPKIEGLSYQGVINYFKKEGAPFRKCMDILHELICMDEFSCYEINLRSTGLFERGPCHRSCFGYMITKCDIIRDPNSHDLTVDMMHEITTFIYYVDGEIYAYDYDLDGSFKRIYA
jgi:hypothetical protein